MHELGIVFHIMDTVEAVAQDNGIEKVQAVTVEVGEVSTVIPDYLIDCWNWTVKKKPMLLGCEMKVETLPAVTHCDGCGENYETVAYGRICPHCGSEKTWLLKGSEINIKDITV